MYKFGIKHGHQSQMSLEDYLSSTIYNQYDCEHIFYNVYKFHLSICMVFGSRGYYPVLCICSMCNTNLPF